ncbi:uncharacterized protein BDV14DRAFT_195321 [Aspergillus stella-maris]|uniref:uncharacterized protein n=1 Tax=Aspergillus stella-maris TaxID=1810926 RepID=UPI003CCC9C68
MYWVSKKSWIMKYLNFGAESQKPQGKWAMSFRKTSTPQGNKVDRYLALLPDLYGLVPRNIQVILSKTLYKLLSYLPSNTQILLNRFFANRAGTFFFYLFIFRYLRLIVHIVSFWLVYKPVPIPSRSTFTPRDCTVIIPTLDPHNPDFEECLTACLTNEPGVIVIVPVGNSMSEATKRVVAPFQRRFPYTQIRVKGSSGDVNNRRVQIATGLQYVNTKITVLMNEHTFWPSPRFLPAILAPFEDASVGIVGSKGRMRRTYRGLSMRSLWGMLCALAIEHENFENRATNALDGSVSVISGRTTAHRSTILTDPNFIRTFTNERSLLSLLAPNKGDEYDFITRWNVRLGYKVKIQHSRDACVETTMDSHPGFLSESRSRWRRNFGVLFAGPKMWVRQPWFVYAFYISDTVDFALVYDVALVYMFMGSEVASEPDGLSYFIRWIVLSRMVMFISYFLSNPQDLVMIPGYLAFGYFESVIKLYALLTFWATGTGTGSRNRGSHSGTVSSKPRARPSSKPKATPTSTPTPGPSGSPRLPPTTPAPLKLASVPKPTSKQLATPPRTPTPLKTKPQPSIPTAPTKPKAVKAPSPRQRVIYLEDPDYSDPDVDVDEDEDDENDPSYGTRRSTPARSAATPSKALRGRGKPRVSQTPIPSIETDLVAQSTKSAPKRRGRPRKVV